MADLVFVTVTVAFFAASAAFVHVCDRVVGHDEPLAARAESPVEARVGGGLR